MARVVTPDQARRLGLAGRNSFEIVSGEMGASNASLRLVEIPVPRAGEGRAGRMCITASRSACTCSPARAAP